jgi:hypothetical protein
MIFDSFEALNGFLTPDDKMILFPVEFVKINKG